MYYWQKRSRNNNYEWGRISYVLTKKSWGIVAKTSVIEVKSLWVFRKVLSEVYWKIFIPYIYHNKFDGDSLRNWTEPSVHVNARLQLPSIINIACESENPEVYDNHYPFYDLCFLLEWTQWNEQHIQVQIQASYRL